MPIASMTGHADLAGGGDDLAWLWEARSVNGRGLDLRLRLPDGFEALEAPLRAAAAPVLMRGSVTIALRIGAGSRGAGLPRLNPAALEAAIAALREAEGAAGRAGLDLAPLSAAEILGLRGVIEAEGGNPAETERLIEALQAEIPELVERLRAARIAEGAALRGILAAQIDRIAALASAARTAAGARGPRMAEALRVRLQAVLGAGAPVDEARLAQELALLAVKADVSEELDRLEAHVDAARVLLDADGPVGRKLDFLTQEFNREANTLTAKAGAADLTTIGLEMKVVIDQMREQVQNVA
jgi:uncharacterized protein (TIGR00255 family)